MVETGDPDGHAVVHASLLTVSTGGRGYRNFFSDGRKLPKFGHAEGLFNRDDGTIDQPSRDALHARLANLASSLVGEAEDNPGIPSGYSYLLQFVAHDMVDSVVAWGSTKTGSAFAFTNQRLTPLSLDTLYGSGPAGVPHAYVRSDFNRVHSDTVPRTRLRLGPLIPGHSTGDYMNLKRDIARGVETSDARTEAPNTWRTVPFVADPRNDAHAMISQLTALFHAFHNLIIDAIDPRDSYIDRPPTEDFQRRFMCARAVVTSIFRAILIKDVLPKILHPDIQHIYLGSDGARFDVVKDSGEGVPVEFSHGAFRFAHAMTRGVYRVNGANAAGRIKAAFLATSARLKGVSPVESDWLVDWAYFFDTGVLSREEQSKMNVSKRLITKYTIDSYVQMEAMNGQRDVPGLANRDLLSSAYAGCWSVPHLVEMMQRKWGSVVPAYDKGSIAAKPALFEIADKIAADPPLPYFVLHEAEETASGLHLGPVGSILVAETILGAIRRVSTEEFLRLDLPDQVMDCAKMLPKNQENGLPDVANANIDSMPKLLNFMKNCGSFD